MILGCLVFALLMACRVQDSEAERYLAALERQDPGACWALSGPGHAEECITIIAAQTDAPALCESLDSFWRDECFFYLVDRTAPPLEKALSLCARTGRYRHNCTEHRFNAAVDRLFRQQGEAVGYARLDVFLAPYVPSEVRPRMIGNVLSRHRFQQLSPDADLEPSLCSGLPDDICQRVVYTHLIRAASAAPDGAALRAAVCPAPVSLEDAAGQGLPVWDHELDRFAQRSWRAYCKRSHRLSATEL